MKKTIMNIMFTTATTIIGLTLYFIFIGEERILTKTIVQLFGVNIMIHIMLLLRSKFEIRNPILETKVDFILVIAIGLTFGFIFGWFIKIPIWIFVVSGIGQYIIASIITISKTKKDMKEVNDYLRKINDVN